MKNLINNKNLNSNYFSNPFLWFLFGITIFLTLIPFFKIGITNCDDLEFYLYGLMKLTAREEYAQAAGRFYFLITKPIYHVAYLVDNFYFTKIIQYGFVLLSFILFTAVMQKIFKQTAFALLTYLLLFAFLTVTPNYFIPIIALPVYFTLSLSIFFLSILALIKYYETNKNKYLILSIILIAIALLFYENFLTFILFVVLIVLVKKLSEQGAKFFKNRKNYIEILPFVLVCIIYVAVYYSYRMYIQTENVFYSGTTIVKDFNLEHFFKVLWLPNKMAFPTFVYNKWQWCLEANSLLVKGHQNSFWYILKNIQTISFVNTLIQCFLFCFLLSKIKPTISWKKIGISALIISIFIFAVNFLLAISEKHNGIYYELEGYVTTYYSYFGVTFFIALFAYSCIKLVYRNRYIKTAIFTVFAFLLFYTSILIGYNNEHLSRDWQRSHGKHLMMEKVIQEGIFDNIPADGVIYLPNYNKTVSRLGANLYASQSYFWSFYIHIKTQRQLNIRSQFESFKNNVQADSLQNIYFITKYEAQKSSDILLVLSKVNKSSIDFENEETAFASATANEAAVYYYSANKEFVFQFVIPQCSEESSVMINNDIERVSEGINAIRIESENKRKEVISFTITSEDAFLVKDFAISNIGSIDKNKVYLFD